MIKAAGLLIRSKSDGSVLFLKRGPASDYPGTWCFPGGKIEDGESPEMAACRETAEEIGAMPTGPRMQLCRTVTEPAPLPLANAVEGVGGAALPDAAAPSPPQPTPLASVGIALQSPTTIVEETTAEGVDFTTFLQIVENRCPVIEADKEHVGFCWAPPDSPPEPLHPGCRTALQALTANELGIARLMAAGNVTSPHRYRNVTLFKLRLTGTGVSFRHKLNEFVLRDPKLYLNDEFLARCNGLPVIYYHPPKTMLNSKEFSKRIIGTVFLPYIQGEEVWCIAKIYDDDAISEMADPEHPLASTSPAIVLGDPADSLRLKMDDGRMILIEGEPILLDHLAVCFNGVWDKGGEPTGIAIADAQEQYGLDPRKLNLAMQRMRLLDHKLKAATRH